MLHRSMHKEEIDNALRGKGDFVKIDELSDLLKQHISPGLRKIVSQELSDIYGRRCMYTDAGKMCENVALACTALSEQVQWYLKACIYYLQAGAFDRVDQVKRKISSEGTPADQRYFMLELKAHFSRQAKEYEEKRRQRHAMTIYEHLLEMNLNEEERAYVKERLMVIYEKLGKVREFLALKKERL